MTSPSPGRGALAGYQGRRNWGPGALWDSVRYLVAFALAGVRRRRTMRRVRSERGALEKAREETLRELGQVGLYMEGIDHPVLRGHSARRDELEVSREKLRETLERHRREAVAEQEQAEKRVSELRDALARARRHRRHIQDRYDDLVEDHQANETKSARAAFEVEFNEKAVREGEEELERLAARDAPVQEIRKARVRLKKARAALDRARRDLPKFQQAIQEVDADLAGLERELDEARMVEQRASDALHEFVEERDARAWARHKEERGLEERLGEVEQEFVSLFRAAGRDLLANRVDHPGLVGRYERIRSMDERLEEMDVALMSLDAQSPALDWQPVFRVLVWLVGLFLAVLLVTKVVGILSG